MRNADCAILILIPRIGRRQSILRAAFSLGLTFQLSRPRGGAPKAGSSIKIRCRRIGIVFDAIFDLALGPLDEPKLRDVATVPAFEFLAAYLAGGAVLVPGHKHELGSLVDGAASACDRAHPPPSQERSANNATRFC